VTKCVGNMCWKGGDTFVFGEIRLIFGKKKEKQKKRAIFQARILCGEIMTRACVKKCGNIFLNGKMWLFCGNIGLFCRLTFCAGWSWLEDVWENEELSLL